MDVELNTKRADLESLRRKMWEAQSNPRVSSKETLALERAVMNMERELNGEVVGSQGWEKFLKGFISRHPSWFGAKQFEEAIEVWDGLEP